MKPTSSELMKLASRNELNDLLHGTDEPKDIQVSRYKMYAETTKQPRILLDFDGTISDFTWTGWKNYKINDFGPPLPNSRLLCERLLDLTPFVEIWTVRMNLVGAHLSEEFSENLKENPRTWLRDQIKSWLKKHDFPNGLTISLNAPPHRCLYIGDDVIGINAPLDWILREVEHKITSYKEVTKRFFE